MIDWLKNLTPAEVLKWGGVVFAYCLGVLVLISIVLSIFEAYG